MVNCGLIAHIDKRSPALPLSGPVEGCGAVIGGFAWSVWDRQLRQRRVESPTSQNEVERLKRGHTAIRECGGGVIRNPVNIHVDICGLCRTAKDGVPK